MKQWVKLDRELTDQDVGKRLRQGLTVAEIFRYTPSYVYVRSLSGHEFPLPTDWSKAKRDDTEIEEEVQLPADAASNLFFPSGSSIVFSNISDPLSYPGHIPLAGNTGPRHDCYLDGHSIVETGTLRSACRHCEQPADWDRESCSWVLKTANNS